MKMAQVRSIVFPVIVFVVIAFAFGSIEAAAAQSDDAPAPAIKAVPAGNGTCPVTGEKIDPNESVTYEYKGKVYNFCCAGCIEQFKKDPEKYLKKMEEEKAGTEAPEQNGSSGHD